MERRISIYLTNLGKYVEGCLMGEWVKLPVDKDKLQDVLDRIGIDGQQYEEYFISDYYTIDRQQFTYAPDLLYYLLLLKYYNSKKTNKNRITIKSLLEHGKFPTIETVRQTKNNSIKDRIIVPFFRNLNALKQVARYTYYSERGKKLTPDEVRTLDYEDMVRVVIHIEWLYDKK